MLGIIVLVLVGLWVFGYLNISGITLPDMTLFAINGRDITMLNLLVFLLVVGAISILPSPFREISGVLLLLWILAIFGVLSIAGFGLPSILLFAIIVGLVISLFSHRRLV